MSGLVASAADASGSTPGLQVSVEPAQSSFFAGEEFVCTITFTNTRDAVPYSAPLPSRARFEDSNGLNIDGKDVQRRVASSSAAFQGRSLADVLETPGESGAIDGPAYLQERRSVPAHPTLGALQDSMARGLHSPMASISNSPALSRNLQHRKAQSVDIKTYARRQQLERSNPMEDENSSDERYYKAISEAADREEQRMANQETGQDEEALAMLRAQELMESMPERRNLIGKRINDLARTHVSPATSTPPLQKRHQRAHSVAAAGYAMSPYQDNTRQQQLLGIGRPDSSPSVPLNSPRLPSHRVSIDTVTVSPQSSRSASSSLRKSSGPISHFHPHSRKRSVAQIPAEDLSSTFEVDGELSHSRSYLNHNDESGLQSATPFDDSRNFIEHSARANGFYGLEQNTTMDSSVREDINRLSRSRQAYSAQNDASLPGTETLLWAYAQFNGYFMIDESLIKPGEFEQVKQRLVGRHGTMSPLIGGGELGDVAEHDGKDASASSLERRRSWTSSLRQALWGSGAADVQKSAHHHRRTGSTLFDMQNKTLASRQIPVFSNPPSMLAVDTKLAPGQSKSYTFRVMLPPDIPPSYVGRAISFTYSLTLGTNRVGHGHKGVFEQKSRLARIPMRIYNHVSISGGTAFSDLTNPVMNYADKARVIENDDADPSVLQYRTSQASLPIAQSSALSTAKSRAKQLSSEDEISLQAYMKTLLSTCSESGNAVSKDLSKQCMDREMALETASTRLMENSPQSSPTSLRKYTQMMPANDLSQQRAPTSSQRKRRAQDDIQAGLGLRTDDDDLVKSSLEAVAILSRNSQKVSYDISKDGEIAAVLTLIKSKYRLGDTMTGVVTVNRLACVARIVRFAATLETHEEIETTLGTLPSKRAQKLTQTLHGKHDDSTLDTGQVCFSLPIPSGATPTFNTSAVRLVWTVRLSFLTLSSVKPDQDEPGAISARARPPPHLVPCADDGYGAHHRVLRAVPSLAGPWSREWNDLTPFSTERGEAKLEVVECAVPLTVLPHSTRFNVGEIAYVA